MVLSTYFITVHKVLEWIGEELYLPKIKRDQMGVYHCIASNGVPPTISKRIIVDVHCSYAIIFHKIYPVIKIFKATNNFMQQLI
jgi:hypothetical protein